MEPILTSYAGMLEQSEFKQWYRYLNCRISCQYTPEEVSFLMSKPPYYFSDYEMFASSPKLRQNDITLLNQIFSGIEGGTIKFASEDIDVFEPRIISVRHKAERNRSLYHISVPWIVLDRSKEKLNLTEFKKDTGTKADLIRFLPKLQKTMGGMLSRSFFRHGRLGYDIYREVEYRCRYSPLLSPMLVKDVLYKLIGAKKLSVTNRNGQLHYQEMICY
ncbi:hypothetical protein [Olivibacter sitiensis]|uniref:hypothetical protein n=1 Tax=Olivibacter sitiensis TaxID=376470 RepID=UPI000485F99F|nr:hypothetical protein [Olivibacter sitiensis]